MTTDGVLRDGQAGIQPQGREAGAAASPAGAMRTVLLGLVSVDALRVYVLRTLPPGALVDGRGELNDQSAHPRDILAVFICGGGVHNILNDWMGEPWTTMCFGILIVVLAVLQFRAWHRKRWVRR